MICRLHWVHHHRVTYIRRINMYINIPGNQFPSRLTKIILFWEARGDFSIFFSINVLRLWLFMFILILIKIELNGIILLFGLIDQTYSPAFLFSSLDISVRIMIFYRYFMEISISMMPIFI